MPFHYRIEHDNRLLSIIGAGRTSMEERSACVDRIMEEHLNHAGYNVLIDVCEVLNYPGPGEIDAIVSLIKRLQNKFGGRIAILNSRAGHVTFTQLITLGADNGFDAVRPFFSLKEARDWLTKKM